MPGQDFERSLVQCFNSYFETNKTRALAYRNKQYRYTSQVFDIFVDSLDPIFYLAIECKSIDARTTKRLYYSQYFHNNAKFPQIQRETEHLTKTGRLGLLAVEVRRGPGKKVHCFLVPWHVLNHSYLCGESGLWPEQITYSVHMDRVKNEYALTDELIEELKSKLIPNRLLRNKRTSWRNK